MQLGAILVATPIVTRLLGPAEFGVVATAMVVSQLLLLGVGLGLPAIATREYYNESAGGLAHARSIVAVSCWIAVPVAATVFAAGAAWGEQAGFGEFGPALQLAVLSAVPGTAYLGAQGIFRALDQAGRFVLLVAIVAGGGHASGLGLVLLGGGATAYIAGLAAGYMVGAVVGLTLAHVNLLSLPSWRQLVAAVGIALPAVMHAMALFVLVAGDRIIIDMVLGPDQTGRYQVAYGIGAMGITVVAAFNNAWAPLIYAGTEASRWLVLATTTRLAQRLAVPIAGGLAIAGPFALLVMAPDSYDPLSLAPVTAVVAAAIFPYVVYLSAAHIVFQRGMTRPLAIVTPLIAALNIVLNLVLIPAFGLMGAAIATVVAYLGLAASLRWVGWRLVRVAWHRRDALASAAVGLALVVVGAVLPVTSIGLVVRGIGAAVMLVLLVRRVRLAISPDDLAESDRPLSG